jgi:hypothetical protein
MPESKTKAEIEHALAKLNVRTACTILDLAVQVLDLLDVQPPAVLEALIEETQRRHVTGPRSRQSMREAYIDHAKSIMAEARERERRLYRGVVGEG